ncbi:hypothetical protein ACFLXN_02640 [Chloroflexota bacterium]
MGFIMDVFFEFLAMLMGFVGLLCAGAGFIVILYGVIAQFTSIDLAGYVNLTLPTWFNWQLGVMIMVVAVLLMSLSSVMRKRIGRVKYK